MVLVVVTLGGSEGGGAESIMIDAKKPDMKSQVLQGARRWVCYLANEVDSPGMFEASDGKTWACREFTGCLQS